MASGQTAGAKRINNPEALRQRVLDVAAASFQQGGYHGTNLRDLVREAGITSGALAHHFPTKKALGRAVIRERVADAVERSWIARIDAAPSAIEGVLGVYEDVIAELDEKQRVEGCPVNNLAIELSLIDKDFRLEIDSLFGKWRDAIEKKARSDDRSVGNLAPDALALLAVAQFSGAMAMAKAAQNTQPLRASADLLRKLTGADGNAR